MNRTELINWIEENLDWYEMSHDYSEPGYSLDEGKELIFFADWNQVKDEAEERRRKKDVIRGRIILAVIIAFGALLLTYPKLKKWWREKETTGLINSLSTSPIPSREL